MDFTPLILTFQLAVVVTAILFVMALPIAYQLYAWKGKLKPVAEALISLPLILPPTVLGFYLLVIFSPNTWLGSFLKDTLDIQIAFSFSGLVLASVIFSLPFMVHPLQSGMSQLSTNMIEAAQLMGKGKWTILLKVIIPNIKPSILAGMVLTFAHTIGEFGVVLMIGGSIPGQTKVASIAIYEEVEKLNYSNAHWYSFVLFLVSFVVLIWVYGYRNYKIKTIG